MNALKFKTEYNVLKRSNQIVKTSLSKKSRLYDNPGAYGNSTKKVDNGRWGHDVDKHRSHVNSTNKVVNVGWGNNPNKQTEISGWDTNVNKLVASTNKVGNGGWGMI